MSDQVIQTAYDNATSAFKSLVGDELGFAPKSVKRKRVPSILKIDPVSGQEDEVAWEPEDSVLFGNDTGLFAFPDLVKSLPDVHVLPQMGLDFQTATLALVPKNPESALNHYMQRMRYDAVPNPNATLPWEKRFISDVTFGVKDKGKAIDRMELENARRADMRLHNALKGFRKKHKGALQTKPALWGMRQSQLTTGAFTAMSRAAFFGIHHHRDSGVFVDYQFSIDYCRNTRPTLVDPEDNPVIDGIRREGEWEAFGTYADRKLHPEERREVITSSLDILKASIADSIAARELQIVPTDKNKAEFARHQVDQAYGMQNAIADNVRPRDYAQHPLRRRWIQLFDGTEDGSIEAMPTPTQMREITGIELALTAEAA